LEILIALLERRGELVGKDELMASEKSASVSRSPVTYFLFDAASAPFPKFVIHCDTLSHELRKQRALASI